MIATDQPLNCTNKISSTQTRPTCPRTSRNNAWFTPKITTSALTIILTDLTNLVTFYRHKTTDKTTRNTITATICRLINKLATLAVISGTTAATTFQRTTSGRASDRRVKDRTTTNITWEWDLYSTTPNTTIKLIMRKKMWKKIIINE